MVSNLLHVLTEGARKLTEEEVEYFIDKADVDQGSDGANV